MRKLLSVIAALALLSAGTALASPFLGTGFDWGWPYLEVGWRGESFCGWVRKYEPNLGHWWSFGAEGLRPLFLEKLSLGIGPRVSIFLGENWQPCDWHFGLQFTFEWTDRPMAFFVAIYSPITSAEVDGVRGGPILPTWPSGCLIEIGFRYLFWCADGGLSICPRD